MSKSITKIDQWISLAIRWWGWGSLLFGLLGIPAWAVFVRFMEIPPHWIYLGGLACWVCTATAANQISALMERRRNPLPKLRMIGSRQSGTCAYVEILNESATVPLNIPVARMDVIDGGKRYTVNHLRWETIRKLNTFNPGAVHWSILPVSMVGFLLSALI